MLLWYKLSQWCLLLKCLSGGKWLLYTMTFGGLDIGVWHPLLFIIFEPSIWLSLLLCIVKKYLPLVQSPKKLMKNMGPHCTVRPWMLVVAFTVALTLEPIKNHYVQYLQCNCLMVSLSHLQRLCHCILIFFGRVRKHHLQVGSLWHLGRKVYETVFAFSLVHCVMEFPPSDLVGVLNRLLRASNLAVCGSQCDSSELPLVTLLAFSDLALACLGGTLLMGWSGVEVLLICALHWSLFAGRAFCWVSKPLVTALLCCSLFAWMASCMDLWTIAISGRGECSILIVRLPDSGDDGLEVTLLLDSLFTLYSDISL